MMAEQAHGGYSEIRADGCTQLQPTVVVKEGLTHVFRSFSFKKNLEIQI